ncbi:MAG: hypothetical protein VXW32_14570 [Myxococcota bacterium]|nr:hypothetical protein [Myxococcota bacterium]
MNFTWLLLGTLTGTASEPAITALASGTDIEAWRELGSSPTPELLQDFLRTYSSSPLAELAVRRLEEQGVAMQVQDVQNILASLIAHEARLNQDPVAVTPTRLVVQPLSREELPTFKRPALASADD